MTKQDLLKLLLERYQANQQTTAAPAQDSGGSSVANLSNILKALKYGKKAYNIYNSLFGSGTTSGAGGAPGAAEGASTGLSEAGATGATNIAGGALGSEGLSGVSWGGALSLAAPLIMSYLKYQAGTGENTPVRKKYETVGAAKYLSDVLTGKVKDLDPSQEGSGYGQYGANIYNRPARTDMSVGPDYSQWKQKDPWQVWNDMMGMSAEGGREINSSLNPKDIYGYLRKSGVDNDMLSKALGGVDMSDWESPDFDYQQWHKTKYVPIWEKLNQQMANPTEQALDASKNPENDKKALVRDFILHPGGVDPNQYRLNDVYDDPITSGEMYSVFGIWTTRPI